MSFGQDTDFLLYFGETKNAQNICKADILYAEDRKTCVVKSVDKIKENMYRIKSPYFRDVFLGEFQDLALYDESAGRIIKTNIREYMDKDKYWKKRMKAVLMPFKYEYEATKNDPYMIGLILGCPRESEHNQEEKTIDNKGKILEIIKQYASYRIDKISDLVREKAISPSIDIEELTNVYAHKFIPKEYIYNTDSVRLSVISGILSYNKPAETKQKMPRVRSKSSIKYNSSTLDLHGSRSRPSINFATYEEEIRPLSSTTRGRRTNSGVSFKNKQDYSIPSLSNSMASISSLQHSDSTASLSSTYSMSSRNKLHINASVRPTTAKNPKNTHPAQYNKKEQNPVTPTNKAPKVYETIIEMKDTMLADQIIFLARSLGHKTEYKSPNIIIYGILGKGSKIYCDFEIDDIGEDIGIVINTQPPNSKIILANSLLIYSN